MVFCKGKYRQSMHIKKALGSAFGMVKGVLNFRLPSPEASGYGEARGLGEDEVLNHFNGGLPAAWSFLFKASLFAFNVSGAT